MKSFLVVIVSVISLLSLSAYAHDHAIVSLRIDGNEGCPYVNMPSCKVARALGMHESQLVPTMVLAQDQHLMPHAKWYLVNCYPRDSQLFSDDSNWYYLWRLCEVGTTNCSHHAYLTLIEHWHPYGPALRKQ